MSVEEEFAVLLRRLERNWLRVYVALALLVVCAVATLWAVVHMLTHWLAPSYTPPALLGVAFAAWLAGSRLQAAAEREARAVQDAARRLS